MHDAEPPDALDIDRLHRDKIEWLGRPHSGRPTDMLVAAIHQSDFTTDPIEIYVPDHPSARAMLRRLVTLGRELGYQARSRSPYIAVINGVIYTAHVMAATPKARLDAIPFVDHSVRRL